MFDFEEWRRNIYISPKERLQFLIINGETNLVLQLIQDHPSLLETRLSHNNTPLLLAAYLGNKMLADALVEKGAKVDFITAVSLGRVDLVEAMLKAEPLLIRKRSPADWTALHLAASCGTSKVAVLLISAGAEVDGLTSRRATPLFFALREPHETAELLLSHGADVNARAKHGFTPLHRAAQWGSLASVDFLLAHGANPNLQTDARQTPWSLSVRNGHREVSSFLFARRCVPK